MLFVAYSAGREGGMPEPLFILGSGRRAVKGGEESRKMKVFRVGCVAGVMDGACIGAP